MFFAQRVKEYNCRVSAVHIQVSANGEYPCEAPTFREGTFLWGPEYLLSAIVRSQRQAVKECEVLNLMEIEKSEALEELERIRRRISKASMQSRHLEQQTFIPPSQESSEVSAPPSLDPSESHPQLLNSPGLTRAPTRTELFEEEIRVKVRDRYFTGTSLDGIVMQLRKEYPAWSPSKTAVWRMVQEGRIIAKAAAANFIANYYLELSLGSDETSSRHKSLLVVNAIGDNVQGKHQQCVLGLVQLPAKDEATVTKAIMDILTEIKTIAAALPSFSQAALSTHLTAFLAYSSDHASTNSAVFKSLATKRKELDPNLDDLAWIRCLMHKYNLCEDYVLVGLRKQRNISLFLNPNEIDAENVHPEDEIMLETKGGMKASLGLNVHSAPDFLYRVSRIFSTSTKGEKVNWGFQFNSQMQKKGIHWKVNPISGSRLHIYSHSALRSYWCLNELKLFLEEKNSSWTKSYLLTSLGSKSMQSEIRVLGYYGYLIAEPITACHNVLTVQDAKTVVQKTCEILSHVLLESYQVSEKEVLWECLLQTKSVKEHQKPTQIKQIGQNREKFRYYLKSILNDWSASDSILLKQVSEEALKELQKIGKEYLEGHISSAIASISAVSTHQERSFAILKNVDTHKKHASTMILEGTLMYRDLVFDSDLKIEPEDHKIIRKLARTGKKAKDVDKVIQEEVEKKEEERKKLRKEKDQRKEERKRKRKESLLGVALEIDAEKVKRMSGRDLVNQLLLWKEKSPKTKIVLKGSAIERRNRIIQLIELHHLQSSQVPMINLTASTFVITSEIEAEIQPKVMKSLSRVFSHLSDVSQGEKEAYGKRKRKRNPWYED